MLFFSDLVNSFASQTLTPQMNSCHHVLILRKFEYGKKWAYGETIRLWKNNSIMEKQFDYGKTIRLWKNNSIMEQNSIMEHDSILKKNRFWNHLFFCISRELRRKSNPESSIEYCHHILIIRKLAFGKKKSQMEKQFRSWIKFRFWKGWILHQTETMMH